MQQFPSTAASDLINIAGMVFKANEVKEQIEVARKLKPNGAAILDVAQKWYMASERIGSSSKILKSAYKGLDIYWDGDAAEIFFDLMDDVTGVADGNRETLFEVGNAVVDLYNTAADGYNEAVLAIGSALKDVTPLDPDKQREEVISVLETFMSGMNARRQAIQHSLSAKQAKMVELRGQILQIQGVAPVPAGMTDMRKWEFDPR
ncbi:hypothetical protein NE235_15285 [Actinoallomurus spadix]|uniref:WXG100 family type VII secretion target n=1 Tax=Actinoallomurus spadix TaxID=79912 RepID=UPI002093D07A|nr:hypothetical protein [Actinoallomurus spadix]MCO5987465.1 hypothetical protein [Actinoallomurus spadix]